MLISALNGPSMFPCTMSINPLVMGPVAVARWAKNIVPRCGLSTSVGVAEPPSAAFMEGVTLLPGDERAIGMTEYEGVCGRVSGTALRTFNPHKPPGCNLPRSVTLISLPKVQATVSPDRERLS